MKIPKYIEFHNETNSILSRYLRAEEPKEGCAILIGDKKSSGTDKKTFFWEIKHIWNCRNIWGQQESKLIDQNRCKLPNQCHQSREWQDLQSDELVQSTSQGYQWLP